MRIRTCKHTTAGTRRAPSPNAPRSASGDRSRRASRPCRALVVALLGLVSGLGLAAEPAPRQAGDGVPAIASTSVAIRARAQRLARSGNTTKALQLLQRALPAHATDPALYNDLAALHASLGHLDKARELLAKGIDTNPVYGLLHRNLTTIYSALAARAYDAALVDRSPARRPPKLALAGVAAAPPATIVAASSSTTPTPPGQPGSKQPPSPVAPPAAGDRVAGAPAPAGATPVVTKVAPASRLAPAEARGAILATLRNWAGAWSGQRVDDYLAFYGHHFAAPKGLSRARWRAQRRARLEGPRYIRVRLRNIEVRMRGSAQAMATFVQSYRSDRLRSTVTKRLRLARKDGRWKIVKEAVVR